MMAHTLAVASHRDDMTVMKQAVDVSSNNLDFTTRSFAMNIPAGLDRY
jgi:hypothetical protein